jgi:hypothetical protein
MHSTILLQHLLTLITLLASTANDVVEVIFLLGCATPFIGAALWFVYNTIRSVHFTARSFNAAKGKALVDDSVSRPNRLLQLPELPMPMFSYSGSARRTLPNSIPMDQAEQLLDSFEKRVLTADHERLYFGHIKTARGIDDGTTSMMILNRASPMMTFLGWITLEKLGTQIEWRLMRCEVRLFRTLSEESSHFCYARDQHESFKKQLERSVGADWADGMFNIVTLNFTTKTGARRAEWFEQYLTEAWTLTLNEAITGQLWTASSLPGDVTNLSSPTPTGHQPTSSGATSYVSDGTKLLGGIQTEISPVTGEEVTIEVATRPTKSKIRERE